jgi:hypothetical protein
VTGAERTTLAPGNRKRRVRLALLVAGLSVVLALVPFARWSLSVTGEENVVEALKGGLALLALDIPDLEADLAPYAPSQGLDVRPYGVNTFFQLEADPALVDRAFALMSGAGITWARQEFPWEDIEIHGRGDFEDRRHAPYRSAWTKYDRIVQAAEDHGVNLLVRLDNPPDWAFADPAASGEKGPPDDLDAFGDFAAEVAARYCGSVRYYQIWNEPNIYPEWGERDVDPAGYAGLLSIAAERVRAACPGAMIVSAALAPTTEPGGRNMDDLAYLAALYGSGWAEDFDVLGMQAFGLWTGPTDRRASADRTNFARAELVRRIMVEHGDDRTPVWITEMGWNSPPRALEAPDRDKYGRASEEVRARYIREAFGRMASEWPWAGVGFVWLLRRPDWEWHQRPEGWFRLVEPDWQLTPSFEELAELALEPLVLSWGTHRASHPALTRTGPWTDAADGAGIVGSAGAELLFPFDGSGYALVTARPAEFKAFVVVDGITGTVEANAGVIAGEMLAASGLESGPHTGIVRVEEGELPLEAIIVSRDPPPSPKVAGAATLALAAAVAGLGVVLVVRAFRAARPEQP